MAEEIKLSLDVTVREAAVIKFLRNSSPFSNIVINKRNGFIERITKEESHTVQTVAAEYGLVAEAANKALLQK